MSAPRQFDRRLAQAPLQIFEFVYRLVFADHVTKCQSYVPVRVILGVNSRHDATTGWLQIGAQTDYARWHASSAIGGRVGADATPGPTHCRRTTVCRKLR